MAGLRSRIAGVVSAAFVLASLFVAPNAASAAPPAPAWTVSVGAAGAVAMPVVSRGRAFAVDGPLVTAVGLARGNVAWQVDHTESGLFLSLGLPSEVFGQIAVPYALDEFSGVYDHDPKTGAVTNGGGNYVLGHIVTRNTRRASLDEAFGGMIGASLISLDYGLPARTGYIAFPSNGEPLEPYSDPVIVGNHVWVGYGGSLMRFERRGPCVPIAQAPSLCLPNGTADIIGNIVGLAAGPNGTVVATTDNGLLQVFDAATGVERWRATLSPDVTAPTVGSGLITVGYSYGDRRKTGELLAFPATGCGAAQCSPSWSVNVGSAIVSAPSVGGGSVVVGTRGRKIEAVSIAACATGPCSATPIGRVASAITGGPVVGGGMVIVGTASGDLVGFRLQ